MKISAEKLAKIFLIASLIFCFSAVLGTIKTVKDLAGKNNLPEVLPVAETTPEVQPEDDIMDWKTYRNEEYGFEFKYPQIFKFESPVQLLLSAVSSNNINLGSLATVDSNDEKGGFIRLSIDKEKLNIKNYVGPFDIAVKDWDNILVDGVQSYINGGGDGPCGFAYIVIPQDNYYIKLIFSDCGMNDSTVYLANDYRDQILSTFKFIEISVEEAEITAQQAIAEKTIKDRATKVISAIKNKYFDELSIYIHPEKGVRFSPYTAVYEEDIYFTKEQVKNLYQSTTEYLWGYRDGSGFPIKETFRDYYSEFVYDQDFASAREVGYNQRLGSGNTVDLTSEFYKDSIRVEYHFSGFNPDYEGMDWESLILIFQEKDSVWYLVGVVHDQWTI